MLTCQQSQIRPLLLINLTLLVGVAAVSHVPKRKVSRPLAKIAGESAAQSGSSGPSEIGSVDDNHTKVYSSYHSWGSFPFSEPSGH